MNRCLATPISWLTLERFALGELGADAARDVKTHLKGCDACAVCHAKILNEMAVPLPPLPEPVPVAVTARARVIRLVAPVAATLSLAAAVMLLVTKRDPAVEAPRDRSKGGDVSLALVSDNEQAEGGGFHIGERFKAVVTCPSAMSDDASLVWDLVAFDADGSSYPLPRAQRVACGNRVPLSGAMTFTGSGPIDVCVVLHSLTDGLPEQSLAIEQLPRGSHASCVRLVRSK